MIILLGYMGSGKSAVGREVATRLNIPFIDFDDYIEAKEGLTIVDIFKQKGEIYFRKAESNYLAMLLEERPDAVIALGGGTPCYGNNMELLLKSAQHIIYLNVSIPNLAVRLKNEKAQRPMIAALKDEELIEFIGKHLFERNVFYQQAPYTVYAGTKSIDVLTDEITALLQ